MAGENELGGETKRPWLGEPFSRELERNVGRQLLQVPKVSPASAVFLSFGGRPPGLFTQEVLGLGDEVFAAALSEDAKRHDALLWRARRRSAQRVGRARIRARPKNPLYVARRSRGGRELEKFGGCPARNNARTRGFAN